MLNQALSEAVGRAVNRVNFSNSNGATVPENLFKIEPYDKVRLRPQVPYSVEDAPCVLAFWAKEIGRFYAGQFAVTTYLEGRITPLIYTRYGT
jgi:hypothetical protein